MKENGTSNLREIIKPLPGTDLQVHLDASIRKAIRSNVDTCVDALTTMNS